MNNSLLRTPPMIPLVRFISQKLARFLVLPFLLVLAQSPLHAQSVSVGAGSYSTKLPAGAIGPQKANGQSVLPKIASTFSQPVQTNDFWSSLIYPYFDNPHSNVLYAHPLNVKAVSNGLQLGYTPGHIFAANDYLYPYAPQLTVGVEGMNSPSTLTESYGDWTVTALWEDAAKQMRATLGHGLAFVYFRITGGNARVTFASTPTVWYNSGGVLGITVQGRHYGIFAPSGSEWTGSGTRTSTLNGKGYLSVALLPDNTQSTLEYFRTHAYAFVTNSLVSWEFEPASSLLTTTYTYETEFMENQEGLINEPLSALYRHQWLHVREPITDFTYMSPRGTMKLYEGTAFSTQLKFSGILPTLPDVGDYNRATLLELVQQVAAEPLGSGPSYENGKAMGRVAEVIHIADQLGATAERDVLLTKLKTRLEDWLSAGGAQEYSYNTTWDVLTGYPSGYGADREINDHHFHSSYAIRGAATIAQYDSAWASQENWGGMINLLVKDSNNWEREDERFPFLRTHDAYAGHSWAAGHGDFGDGNNQESSSESMNFATATFLWGAMTGQDEIRDLGIFLHANEMIAVDQYWFDVDNAVFPQNYPFKAIGMVWGGKGVHSTWFGAEPEFIHGINFLPVHSGSLYLGRHPDYVIENFDEIVAERRGQPVIWKDVMWQYLALSDADRALSLYLSDPGYTPFDGESKAHTMHWLYNFKKMGRPDTAVSASVPLYSVFVSSTGDTTYAAFNVNSSPLEVQFSDGFSMTIPARALASHQTNPGNPDAPVALLTTDKASGKTPLRVEFNGSRSFDRNGGALTYLWDFGNGITSTQADTVVTFTEPGEYSVLFTVTTGQGISTSDSVHITALGNGTPFSGSPVVIPGRIEAENYDKGGEGVAYHDVDANNIGLAYRPSEGVDIEGANDGGFDVYWIVAGEWLEYTVEVKEAGTFDIIPYMTTVPGFGRFSVFVNNVQVGNAIRVPHTGGWQNWTAFPVGSVFLETGRHIVRFEFNSTTDKNGWLMSFNYFQMVRSQSVSTDSDPELPEAFALLENYPNPFNPTTQIQYSLPESVDVILSIFNALGQRVGVLVNERKAAGFHTITFEASDLPSGIYFYNLQAGSFSQTRAMMLIK